MEILQYDKKYETATIALILNIQNNEAKINLTLSEQPDLIDIESSHISRGGNFWIAVDNGQVIGTIALMNLNDGMSIIPIPTATAYFTNSTCRSGRCVLQSIN
ncbi:MAG: hypothetical protein NC230_09825 [Bacteroides sp.]|nr:hypothetical protein [Bacteroides sp.]MCM1517822.1 hypothetical protein [Pseudoflavonifractor sp.]